MKRLIATTAAAGALLAAATVAAPAHAANGVSATYGCRSITFTNSTSQPVRFNYGTNNSDDPGRTITVAAKGSKTVQLSQAEAQFIGWDARTTGGTELQGRPSWGTNVNALCKGSATTSKPTAKASTGAPATAPRSGSGGLARTGW